MKKYGLHVFVAIIILLFGYSSWKFIDFLESKKDNLQNFTYKLEASSLQQKLDNEILQKQEFITNIAFTIASNQDLKQKIINGHIPQGYYAKLIKKLRTSKLYKNIWVQVINKNGISIYRSWTKNKNDTLIGIRKDLKEVILTKKAEHSISIGRYDLSFKSIVPLSENHKFIGIVEVIAHFNSITEKLQKLGIDSVVVAKKEYTKQLKYPFTKLFIGGYYVANFDAPSILRNYLSTNGVENYFNNSYKVQNGYLIVSYPLKNWNLKTIGYFIMFKRLNTCSNKNLDFFMLRWSSLFAIAFMFIITIISITLLFINRRQKAYYRNIIDSASDIVMIYKMETILRVNDAFYKIFDRYNSVGKFLMEHECICDFFVKEKGYLQKNMNGMSWIAYLLKYSSRKHIAKINFYGKEYYFVISASMILNKSNYCSIILSDITKQEIYKKKLEVLIVTDDLTGIKNRRYFLQSLENEMHGVNRYGYPLSLIMADIDFFKDVNDKYGHHTGDKVLITYTKLISSLLRDEDIFCRFGGEEFMIILPYINLKDAAMVAEKLRKEIELYKKIAPITMSFGVVQYIKNEKEESIYKRVDSALYKAKKSGRNIVIVG